MPSPPAPVLSISRNRAGLRKKPRIFVASHALRRRSTAGAMSVGREPNRPAEQMRGAGPIDRQHQSRSDCVTWMCTHPLTLLGT